MISGAKWMLMWRSGPGSSVAMALVSQVMRLVVVSVGRLRPPYADDVQHYKKLLARHARLELVEVREDEQVLHAAPAPAVEPAEPLIPEPQPAAETLPAEPPGRSATWTAASSTPTAPSTGRSANAARRTGARSPARSCSARRSSEARSSPPRRSTSRNSSPGIAESRSRGAPRTAC